MWGVLVMHATPFRRISFPGLLKFTVDSQEQTFSNVIHSNINLSGNTLLITLIHNKK